MFVEERQGEIARLGLMCRLIPDVKSLGLCVSPPPRKFGSFPYRKAGLSQISTGCGLSFMLLSWKFNTKLITDAVMEAEDQRQQKDFMAGSSLFHVNGI